MMDTQTYIVKRQRAITAEEQNVCDICKEPATHGCTDAIETTGGWTQSKMRYGCNLHTVVSIVEYLNADQKTN